MTEIRPPPEHVTQKYHWMRFAEDLEPVTMEWFDAAGFWMSPGVSWRISATRAADLGWSYVGPIMAPNPTEIAPTARDAYAAACRIVDRDHAAGMEVEGIIDNVLAELARMAGEPPKLTDASDAAWAAFIAAAKAWARHMDQWDKFKFETEYGMIYVTISMRDLYPGSFEVVE